MSVSRCPFYTRRLHVPSLRIRHTRAFCVFLFSVNFKRPTLFHMAVARICLLPASVPRVPFSTARFSEIINPTVWFGAMIGYSHSLYWNAYRVNLALAFCMSMFRKGSTTLSDVHILRVRHTTRSHVSVTRIIYAVLVFSFFQGEF